MLAFGMDDNETPSGRKKNKPREILFPLGLWKRVRIKSIELDIPAAEFVRRAVRNKLQRDGGGGDETRAEVEWLLDQGAIAGLTNEEVCSILQIAAAAKLAMEQAAVAAARSEAGVGDQVAANNEPSAHARPAARHQA